MGIQLLVGECEYCPENRCESNILSYVWCMRARPIHFSLIETEPVGYGRGLDVPFPSLIYHIEHEHKLFVIRKKVTWALGR